MNDDLKEQISKSYHIIHLKLLNTCQSATFLFSSSVFASDFLSKAAVSEVLGFDFPVFQFLSGIESEFSSALLALTLIFFEAQLKLDV